jgi:hypothetical protein
MAATLQPIMAVMPQPTMADMPIVTIMRRLITATATAGLFVRRSPTTVDPDIMAAGVTGGIAIGNFKIESDPIPAAARAVAGFHRLWRDKLMPGLAPHYLLARVLLMRVTTSSHWRFSAAG